MEEPVPTEPTPEVEPEPVPQPEAEVLPEPEPNTHEENVTPEVVVITEDTDLESLDPQTPVQLENGVILTAEVVIALEVLGNPADLVAAIFTDPAQALMALANVGADMSPEVREQAEDVIVAAVIAGNIATQAAASAAAAAAYRRNL
jgi:hypothetical protein